MSSHSDEEKDTDGLLTNRRGRDDFLVEGGKYPCTEVTENAVSNKKRLMAAVLQDSSIVADCDDGRLQQGQEGMN
jgi:hypothetical protein